MIPSDFWRKDAALPRDVELREELDKGANNRVFRAWYRDEDCILRVPRRKSDTQQRGSALWECLHTIRASELQAGPKVHETWYARHASGPWPSGLYMLMDRYHFNLEDYLVRDRPTEEVALRMGDSILECLESLSKDHLYVYDLKPTNVVVRAATEEEEGEEEGQDEESTLLDIRIIDFGRDFCEWSGRPEHPDCNTPILTMLHKRLHALTDDVKHDTITHILFSAMAVQLSASITQVLYEDRHTNKMGEEERRRIHPLASHVEQLLESMQGKHKALLRQVLRADVVRGVLRHYHGRRDAGTRRILRLAVNGSA